MAIRGVSPFAHGARGPGGRARLARAHGDGARVEDAMARATLAAAKR